VWKNVAKWDGDKLVVKQTRTGDDGTVTHMTSVWSIAGDVLTIERTGDKITKPKTVYRRVK
jgi:hypothetical protein